MNESLSLLHISGGVLGMILCIAWVISMDWSCRNGGWNSTLLRHKVAIAWVFFNVALLCSALVLVVALMLQSVEQSLR